MAERPESAHDEISSHQYSVKGVIDRLEAESAAIHLDTGQEIQWPRGSLPDDAREGTAIRLLLTTSAIDHDERTRIAKILLNEILASSAS